MDYFCNGVYRESRGVEGQRCALIPSINVQKFCYIFNVILVVYVATLMFDGEYDGNIFISILIYFQSRISGISILIGTHTSCKKVFGRLEYFVACDIAKYWFSMEFTSGSYTIKANVNVDVTMRF